MDMKKVKYILAGIVIILMGIVIVQNFEEQEIMILFVEIKMPLAILLVLTFIVGAVAGWVATLMTTKQVIPKEVKETKGSDQTTSS